jgi:hypothetical protein
VTAEPERRYGVHAMRQRFLSVVLLSIVAIASPWILTADAGTGSGLDSGSGSGPRVTIFGDSVADSLNYVPQARQLLSAGIDLRLELAPCRKLVPAGCAYMGGHPPSVLDIVNASSPASLGDIVIVDVGYNDPENNYDTDMGSVVGALLAHGVAHIVWVTLREANDNYRQMNDIIRDRARREPRIAVADWDKASRGKPWFNSDALHLNADGAMGLATLLRPFVLAACGSACAPAAPLASAPKNVRPPFVRGAPVVGQTLTCRPGRWSGTRPLAFSYRWLRDDTPVLHETTATKLLKSVDRGHELSCRVWAANASGATAATSRTVLVQQQLSP